MDFSSTLAVVLGVFLRVAETMHRWDSWRAEPLALFDDYIFFVLVIAALVATLQTKLPAV